MKCNPTIKIYGILSTRCLLFITIFLLCSLINHKDLMEIAHWWSIIASIINIITLALLWHFCKKSDTTYRKLINYQKSNEPVSKGIIFIVFMLLIGMGGMYLAGLICYGDFSYIASIMIAPISPFLAIFNVFILPISTTFAEDGLYLGCGVNGFPKKVQAISVPAFFYALQHSFIPTIFDFRFIFYRFLSFLPLTVWICYKYYKKRNPIYIMIGHLLLNIATTIQIVITSFSPEIYYMMLQ